MSYSVLMSVYYKEKPEYLRQSIESMLAQTVQTDDLVLVCDGPLTPELNTVINELQNTAGNILRVVRLKDNCGLGNALNIGIQFCKNDLIARMDTDDIAHRDRCEKQLAVFNQIEVDIVGAAVEEFSISPDVVEVRRVPPETHEEILKFAKRRNPFNHPCVMYRKSAVEAAGNYKEIFLLEDYFLWIRMFLHGSKGYNIQEPLLWMRAGSEMYKRRGGWKYVGSQIKLFGYMKEHKIITTLEFMESVVLRTASSLSPNWTRKIMFKKFMRK